MFHAFNEQIQEADESRSVSICSPRRGKHYLEDTTSLFNVPPTPKQREALLSWLQTNISNLFLTRHFRERVIKYSERLSVDGSYYEVTTSESRVLLNETEFLQWVQNSIRFGEKYTVVVEIGINRGWQVCKVAICMRSPAITNSGIGSIQETTDRILFLCIGMDGGMKTFYITPGYKETSHIPRFSIADFL